MKITTFEAAGSCADEFAEGVLATGVPYIDKDAVLFQAGTYQGRRFDRADLDKMARSFSAPTGETDWTVPVQIDHSDSARDTVGHVREVRREDDRLVGKLRFVGADAIEKVKGGLWKRLSQGIRADLSLHHVAVTPHPRVLSAKLFQEKVFQEKESEDQNMPTEPATKPDAKPEAKPETQAPEKPPEAPTTATTAAAATFKSVEQLEAQFAEKTSKLEAMLAAQQKTLDKQAEVIRFADLASKIDTFSEAGKTAPCMRDAELALLKTFSDEQLALYVALKDKQPSIIDFSIRGSQDSSKPGDGSEDDQAKAEALAKKYWAKKGQK